MFLQRFFVPEAPAGYRPGALLAQIAERDVPEMESCSNGTEAAIPLGSRRIDVRERVRRDFLQHTALAVFGMGEAGSEMRVIAHHTGKFGRTGVRFEGDPVLSDALDRPYVIDALLPLDFTRLEVTGRPQAYRLEIETYGAAEVVMRLPRVRRYIPLGPEQSTYLLRAFEAISTALAVAGSSTEEGVHQ